MTTSVVRLINLCGTQNLKDYYDDFCLWCCVVILFTALCSLFWRLTWPSHLSCLVKNFFCFVCLFFFFFGLMTKTVVMWDEMWKAIVELFLGWLIWKRRGEARFAFQKLEVREDYTRCVTASQQMFDIATDRCHVSLLSLLSERVCYRHFALTLFTLVIWKD